MDLIQRGVVLSVLALIGACSSTSRVEQNESATTAGAGGDAGSDAGGAPTDSDSDNSSGGVTTGSEGGSPESGGAGGTESTSGEDGGTSGSGASGAEDGSSSTGAGSGGLAGTGGLGGTGSSLPTTICSDQYHDWFKSAFEFPDGVVGPADFPTSPWATVIGGPINRSGALASSGESVAIASMGAELPKEGLRLRYRVVFRDEDNEARVGVDADDTGDASFSVLQRASDGLFAVLDGQNEAASVTLGALELGAVYFVEVELDGVVGNAYVSRENYATVPGAVLVAELDLSGMNASAGGPYVMAGLVESGGSSPELQTLSVARCGEPAPEYEDVFVDTFDRADSSSVGTAELPSNSVWDESEESGESGGIFDILGNRLRLSDGFTLGLRARAARGIGNEAARLRAVVAFGTEASWPSIQWAVESVPAAAEPAFGFFLWNNEDEARIGLRGFGGGAELGFDGPFEAGENYYVEIAIDGIQGVAVVRSTSFTGPVIGVVADDRMGSPPATNDFVQVLNAGNDWFSVDEVRLSQYVADP